MTATLTSAPTRRGVEDLASAPKLCRACAKCAECRLDGWLLMAGERRSWWYCREFGRAQVELPDVEAAHVAVEQSQAAVIQARKEAMRVALSLRDMQYCREAGVLPANDPDLLATMRAFERAKFQITESQQAVESVEQVAQLADQRLAEHDRDAKRARLWAETRKAAPDEMRKFAQAREGYREAAAVMDVWLIEHPNSPIEVMPGMMERREINWAYSQQELRKRASALIEIAPGLSDPRDPFLWLVSIQD